LYNSEGDEASTDDFISVKRAVSATVVRILQQVHLIKAILGTNALLDANYVLMLCL
jgi:hypothetical protein